MDPLTYRRLPVNGIELEVSVSNEGGPRGLALLLHGFPEAAFSWRFQIPALVAAGYEVWAPNTRGYAGSDKPTRVADYDLDVLLEDLGALIDLAGRDEVTLIGHDWGAVQAWAFAMRRTRPIDRLVIMNVPHPACMQRELRTFRQLRRSWYVFFFQIPWLPERLFSSRNAKAIGEAFTDMAVDASRFPPEVTDVYRRNAQRPHALRSMINYYRAAVRGLRRDRDDVDVIDTPTLMIWGLEDTALGRETTDGTDEYVSDLTMRFLPDVSHWVQQEAPETVNAMLLAWLAGEPVPEHDQVHEDRLADPALRRRPVHGIGGVFFRSADPAATRAWYAEHLGLGIDDHGSSFRWRRDGAPDALGHTLWSPFPDDTDYFGDADQQAMVNFRVDDLDALLADLVAAGVEVSGEIEEQPFGRFTHIVDNEGRRVELWEPVEDEYVKVADGITPS